MMSDEANPREDAAELNLSHPDLPEANPPAEDPAPAAENAEGAADEVVYEVPGVGTYKGATHEEVIQKMDAALRSSSEEGRRLAAELRDSQTARIADKPVTPASDAPDWRAEAEELALPPEKLQAIINGMFTEMAAPFAGAQAADAKLSTAIEGYDGGKLDQFIQGNQEVAQTYTQMLTVNPEAAREWAYGKLRASEAGRELARARQQAETDAGAQAEERATAATVTQRHRAADVQATTAERDARRAAIDRYHETGDPNDLLDDVMPIHHPELAKEWIGKPDKGLV